MTLRGCEWSGWWASTFVSRQTLHGAFRPSKSMPPVAKESSDTRRLRSSIVVKTPIFGNPDMSRAGTSRIERQNLTVRMSMRRMTRLTNAFSKKWLNHKAAYALYFAHYNFSSRSFITESNACDGSGNYRSHLDYKGTISGVTFAAASPAGLHPKNRIPIKQILSLPPTCLVRIP